MSFQYKPEAQTTPISLVIQILTLAMGMPGFALVLLSIKIKNPYLWITGFIVMLIGIFVPAHYIEKANRKLTFVL